MIYSKDNPSAEYKQLLTYYKDIHKNGAANRTPQKTYNGTSTLICALIF